MEEAIMEAVMATMGADPGSAIIIVMAMPRTYIIMGSVPTLIPRLRLPSRRSARPL